MTANRAKWFLNLGTNKLEIAVVPTIFSSMPSENTNYYDLFAACTAGALQQVKRLIDLNEADVNKTDIDGCTALMMASKNGFDEICRLLIQKGAKIDSMSNNWETALMLACQMGHEDVCRLLVSKGSNVNYKSKSPKGFNRTALWYAACGGYATIVRLLVDHGAILDEAASYGLTPLIAACYNGHEAVCQILIKQGANVNIIYNGPRGHMKYMLDSTLSLTFTGFTSSCESGTALTLAARSGYVKLSQLLVDAGAYKSDIDINGETPLILAASSGHHEIVKLLLKKDLATLDFQNKWGETALMRTCVRKQLSCFKTLLEKGANVVMADENGDTPLILAAAAGSDEIVSLLMDKSMALLEHKNNMGQTALMKACRSWHDSICRFLIKKGARVDTVDENLDNPLILATELGWEDVVRAISAKRLSMLNEQNNRGETALMCAFRVKHREICKFLIQKGAKDDLTDDDWQTPLMLAVEYGWEDVVKDLLTGDYLSNLEAKNSTGHTALAIACYLGYTEICKILLENGADAHTTTNFGEIPLIIAVRYCRVSIVRCLIPYTHPSYLLHKDNTGKCVIDLLTETAYDPNANPEMFKLFDELAEKLNSIQNQ